MPVVIHPASGPASQRNLEAYLRVYRAAFSQPPYHERASSWAIFSEALPRHASYPGFRSYTALAVPTGEMVGFAYGYTSRPRQWWSEHVSLAMPEEMKEEWLEDCFELAELAVVPAYQGQGIGGQLHDRLIQDLPHRTAVLSTLQEETRALHLYRKRRWVPLLENFYFPGDPRPFLIMGLELKPRVER